MLGFIGLSFGVMVSLLIVKFSLLELPLIILAVLVLLFLTFKYPEAILALFLTSGAFKTFGLLRSVSSVFDITVLLGVFCLLGILYKIQKTGEKQVAFPKTLLFLFVSILIISSLSFTYSSAKIYGTEKLFKLLTLTTFSFVAPFFLVKTTESFQRFLKVFLVIGILMFVDVLIRGLNARFIGFYSALGANYLMFGRIEGFAIIACMFYFLINSNSTLKKVAYFTTTISFLFSLLLSASRGPLISLIVSIAFLSLYSIAIFVANRGKNTTERVYAAKTINITLTFVIIIIVLVSFFGDYFATLFYRFAMIQQGIEESLVVRLSMYNKAIEVLLSFPKNLIGIGLGGYSVLYTGVDSKMYPHNIFLEIASESGIFALLAFVVLVSIVVLQVVKEIRSADSILLKSTKMTIMGLFIYMLINASFSLDINDNRLLFTVMSLVFSVGEAKKIEKR